MYLARKRENELLLRIHSLQKQLHSAQYALETTPDLKRCVSGACYRCTCAIHIAPDCILCGKDCVCEDFKETHLLEQQVRDGNRNQSPTYPKVYADCRNHESSASIKVETAHPEMRIFGGASGFLEQYDVLDESGNTLGYMRYKNAYFTVCAPDAGGEEYYSIYYGRGEFCEFPSDKERYKQFEIGKEVLSRWWQDHPKEL